MRIRIPMRIQVSVSIKWKRSRYTLDSPRGAHVSTAGFSDTSFALAIGAGIDTRLAGPFQWRMIQADYLPTWFGNAREDNARISTGIVIHF